MKPADQQRRHEPVGDEQEPDYRFTLANERTFLAWIRTALALIAGGVAVVQLVLAFGIPGVRYALGVLLTTGGGLLVTLAVRRWQRVQAAMRRDADLPPTRLPVLLGITLLAVTILVLVVLLVPQP
jgi:putative membrane protein